MKSMRSSGIVLSFVVGSQLFGSRLRYHGGRNNG
jgi:hypothetical protein